MPARTRPPSMLVREDGIYRAFETSSEELHPNSVIGANRVLFLVFFHVHLGVKGIRYRVSGRRILSET